MTPPHCRCGLDLATLRDTEVGAHIAGCDRIEEGVRRAGAARAATEAAQRDLDRRARRERRKDDG